MAAQPKTLCWQCLGCFEGGEGGREERGGGRNPAHSDYLSGKSMEKGDGEGVKDDRRGVFASEY